MKRVTAEFNIHDHGRLGHKRNYNVDNVLKVIRSPETQEKIRNREAVGYYGHGRRIAAGKNAIEEFEVITTKSGGTIAVENVPALVTIKLEGDKQGNIMHEQEFLDTKPGLAALALYENKVGGFSWAMGGRDGGQYGLSTLSDYNGMDYVIEPGFAANRGFDLGVMESASNAVNKELLIQSMLAAGLSLDEANIYVESFFDPFMIMREIQEKNEATLKMLQKVESNLEKIKADNANLQAELESAKLEQHNIAAKRQEMLMQFADKMHFNLDTGIFESSKGCSLKQELSMFEKIVNLFERRVKGLPVSSNQSARVYVPKHSSIVLGSNKEELPLSFFND